MNHLGRPRRPNRILSKIASGGYEGLNTNQKFIATLDDQRVELVCSLGSFIAFLAMSLPNVFTSLHFAEVYTVPRLRRLLQILAAIGWLQRNSSRSKEGRVSWPGRRGNSSRSKEGRFLDPRSGWLQRTVAQWLSADSGARWCFPADAGCQVLSGLSDAPTLPARCTCQAATEHRH